MHKKMAYYFLGYVLSLFFAMSGEAKLENVPYISSGSCLDVGKDLLNFAQKAYDSTIFDLSDYDSLLNGLSELPTDLNVSLMSDNLFENNDVTISDKLINFSWPKELKDHYTFVRISWAFSWRGDWYSLYWIPSTDLSKMIGDAAAIRSEDTSLPYKLLGSNLWQKPFFLRIKNKVDLIGVIPSRSSDPMNEWTLYIPSKNGELSRCQIQFHPATDKCNTWTDKDRIERIASQFFSRKSSLYALIEVLDDIIGPGSNEGTLQTTARIRNYVCKLIVNIAIRPWVLGAMVKKSKKTEKINVENNLEKWSLKNHSFQRQYRKMKYLYPLAEQELADYYKTKFDMDTVKAVSIAKENLERLYMSFFHFPSSE